jgi:hypothetical protein
MDAYAGEERVITMRGATHWNSVTGDAQAQLAEAIDWLWQRGATQ